MKVRKEEEEKQFDVRLTCLNAVARDCTSFSLVPLPVIVPRISNTVIIGNIYRVPVVSVSVIFSTKSARHVPAAHSSSNLLPAESQSRKVLVGVGAA